MNKSQKIAVSIVVCIIIALGLFLILQQKTQAGPGKLDAFATCLKDNGAIFYGAFWCPHCQNQKTMFGSSEKLLPYVECSTPDGQRQTQECIDKKIEGYPTWEFKDGSRLKGEVPLQTLAEKTNCILPSESQ